ncbi:MAG: hypothetical protein WBD27_12230 [Pyrinomonadaceae bacterium]
MTDPFHSSKYQITWAKKHFSELNRQIADFESTNPYALVTEVDANSGDYLHKVKLTKPLPADLPGLVIVVANSLRAALDQAMYAILKRKFACFPVSDDEAKFNKRLIKWSKDVPQEIIDFVRLLEPYKGANNSLWVLNEISNANKHGIICPMANVVAGMVVDRLLINEGYVGAGVPVWDRTKNEMILLRSKQGSAFDADVTFTYCIAMCDIEFVEGRPATEVLGYLGGMVERIIVMLEEKAIEIGAV